MFCPPSFSATSAGSDSLPEVSHRAPRGQGYATIRLSRSPAMRHILPIATLVLSSIVASPALSAAAPPPLGEAAKTWASSMGHGAIATA